MAKKTCAACRQVMPKGARFCPSCGAEASAALTIDVIYDSGRHGGGTATVELHPSRRPLLVVGVAATALVLLGLAVAASRPAPVTPTAPLGSTAPTTALSTTTVAASTTTAPLLVAHAIPVPAGLHGDAWFLLADGSVIGLDLTTGTLRVAADGVIERIYGISSENARFVALDGGFLVWIGARVALVPLDPNALPVAVGDNLDFVAGGDHYVVLRRDQPGLRIVRIVVDSHGNITDLPDIGSITAVVGVAGERLVVQAADQIGVLDPTQGTVTPAARGTYVASNRWGLARLECPHPPTCELHTGPWSSLDERIAPAAFTIPVSNRAGSAQLSADGSRLVVPGPGTIDVIDTATGHPTFPTVFDPKLFALSPDGTEALTLQGGQARLERPGAAPVPLQIGGDSFRRVLVGVALTD